MLGGLVMAARENKSGFDERLVELFRNRAQLKKAHQALQQDFHSLEEKLKNAEASTRRAEERLEAIERLMAKPEAGYNGLVYFQLRSLWRACFDQLGVFAEELRKHPVAQVIEELGDDDAHGGGQDRGQHQRWPDARHSAGLRES